MKCRKNTENKNLKRNNNLSKCTVHDSKKPKFVKQQEAGGLLSKLIGIKVPNVSDLLVADILF